MDLPDCMIHQSVRYCLGRRSYAVSECTDWLIANWQEIPEGTRVTIKRDVEMLFEMEKHCPADNENTIYVRDEGDYGKS